MQLVFGRNGQKQERQVGYRIITCSGLGWYMVPTKPEGDDVPVRIADLYEFFVKFAMRSIAYVTRSQNVTFSTEKCKASVTATFPFITDEIWNDAMDELVAAGLLLISGPTQVTAHWRSASTEQRKQYAKDYLLLTKISRGNLKEIRVESLSDDLREDLKVKRVKGTTIVLESFFVTQLFMSSTYIRDSRPNTSFSTFCSTHLEGLVDYYLSEPKRPPVIAALANKYHTVYNYFEMISYRGDSNKFLSLRNLIGERETQPAMAH